MSALIRVVMYSTMLQKPVIPCDQRIDLPAYPALELELVGLGDEVFKNSMTVLITPILNSS